MKKWLVVLVLLAGCGGSPEPEDPAAIARRMSDSACKRFRSIDAPVLTPAELREEVKKVEERGTVATGAIRDASRQLLVAVTQRENMGEAVKQMDEACKGEGF